MKHAGIFNWQNCLISFCVVTKSLILQGSELTTVIEENSFDELLTHSHNVEDITQIPQLTKQLWQKYQQTVQHDISRTTAHQQMQLQDGDKVMRFSKAVKGEKPEDGYPLYIALHGGGGTASSVNDSQWEHMKVYYLNSVDNGVYVATRGVTNTWNLHFVDESYRLYDYLIENMIALEGVNPNRVYLIGFSAGGDGVYQITPRMADRWAAANMSAGHHNWIRFDNLFQTPFLIQMGQFDSAYQRNTVAVENYMELQRLQAERGGYPHDLFLHYRGSHNSWRDNDPSGREYEIIADPIAWLEEQRVETRYRNTNGIHWMNQYTRNPYPTKIYWDPQTNAPRHSIQGAAYLTDANIKAQLAEPRELFYWLDLSLNLEIGGDTLIEAAYDFDSNTISLAAIDHLDHLRLLIHQEMLDLSEDISIVVDGKLIARMKLQADLKTMTRTLLERGDPSYVFPSEVTLVKMGSDWVIAE